MIVEKDEWELYKKLSRNRTAWWEKNAITCAKCYYCNKGDSYPTCDYAAKEHHSKHCTGLTCIQRGIFVPANDKVNLEKVKKKYARWLKEQFARDSSVAEMWERLNDGQHGFARDPELSGGRTLQGLFDCDKEAVQKGEMSET